ncbi:sugar transferase [Fusobacterium sp. PH5-44]|uniref:sugar transferase n=1 Tax=unclassified Fusobacterium TaxID=2648384 RepID=UPI003D25796A
MKRHFIKIFIIALQFAFYFFINKAFHVHDRIMYNTFFIYLVLTFTKNMYSFKTILVWEEIKRQIKVHAQYMMVMLINDIAFWGQQYIVVHLVIGATFTFFNIGILSLTRKIFKNYLKKNLIIIGIGNTAKKLTNVIKKNGFTLYDLLGYVSVNNIPGIAQTINVDEGKILGDYENLETIIDNNKIKEVIIAVPLANNEQMNDIVDKLDGKVSKIKFIPEFNGQYTFNSRIEDYDGIMVISSYNGMKVLTGRMMKRIIDIVGAIVGLGLVGITTLVFARKIKKDGGKIFFKHNRVGKDLKPFKMYKYRTMYVNAEEKLQELLDSDEKIKKEFYKNFKLKNDPRITSVGKFLRESSLDELPQFINVLKGEMSLVGPRPVVEKEVEMYYGKEMSKKIFMVKPGITGMWQAHGRSDVENYDERIALDLYYIRNWSLWLDIVIMIKTVRNVLEKKGAY